MSVSGFQLPTKCEGPTGPHPNLGAKRHLRRSSGPVRKSHRVSVGVAFFAAMISGIQNRRVQAGSVILGDLTIQGNIRSPASIVEPLQLVLDSGALRVLIPLANKAQFAGLPEEVVEKLDIVFYGDVDRAVLKTLEM